MIEKPVDIRNGFSMLEKKQKKVKLTGRKDDKIGVVSGDQHSQVTLGAIF